MGRKAFTQQKVELYCLERGYKLLSRYANSLTKITLQNIENGKIGEMLFSNFMKGQRFDNPKATKKLTQQEVEEYCLEHGYRVLSEYINSNIKITLQNIETGGVGEMLFSDFRRGHRFDNPKATKKLTQQEVESHCLKHGYRLLNKYVNSRTKIKLQNIETGETGDMWFGNFKEGSRFDTQKLTYKEFILPFISEGYTVLIDEKDYKNVNVISKIDVTCPNKHKWSVARNHFTSKNQRCPVCHQNVLGGMSLGEKLVYQLLQGNGIAFEREKSVYIDDKLYRFDFYFEVGEFGYIDKFIIEYDGIQHYHERSGYLSGGLKKIQTSDKIKNKYARDNNIKMIRIPWLNNTIDKILFVINGSTGLNLHSVNVDLPTIQVVADYYLTHSVEETMNKFNICNKTTRNYFKQIHGMSKREYLNTSKQEVQN